MAYSAICTHLGCAVFEKLTADGLILCPCHGSLYDPANAAAVRRGPSDRALPSLPISAGPNATVLAGGSFSAPVGPQRNSDVDAPHQVGEASLPDGEAHPDMRGWFEERLRLSALADKYGRKAFPVHSSFFLGEIAAFSFLILVVTGVYPGLIYTPSNANVQVAGQQLPEAFASVRLIESIPVANLIRNVHHWAAHVMIATILLHAARVYFTGTYRAPRDHLGTGHCAVWGQPRGWIRATLCPGMRSP